MHIKFNVNNQIIKRTDTNRVVADSRNYLYATFTFSEEWHGVKTAIFKNGDVVKQVILKMMNALCCGKSLVTGNSACQYFAVT